MNKNYKIYDKNGTLLKDGDRLTDGYDNTNWLKIYWDEWYIAGNKDIWQIEEFRIDCYKDGFYLIDFEKVGK